ncbi:MAG: DUF2079 domain-containing protein, partial [Clostridia bacterium]|nr:DUF2079 domain-containing protein [Clostridia bacterium]
ALIPHPLTLLVMQLVFLFSGVVPLLLVARKYKLSRPVMLVLSFLYFAYPAMVGGTFYDMHENKLLLPLILWLLWAIETERVALSYPFAILVLFVKEDAPIYVAFVALWWLASRPNKRHAVIQLLLAIWYFMFAVTMLEKFGDGAMFGRYSNLIGANGTPIDLLRTALINPALILRELLDLEKMAFIVYMLMPLGLIPLITRKFSRLILVLPMVLINLMPDYYYQHDIGYQYTYGVAAMLFFLLVLNVADLRGNTRRGLLIFACCATILLASMRAPLQIFYADRYTQNIEDSRQIAEHLKVIPEDASVLSSTMFTPHLSRRSELYLLNSKHNAEYVVIDLRPYVNASIEGYDLAYFEARGCEMLVYVDNLIAILKTPS